MYLLVRSFGAAAAVTVDDGDAQCLWSLTQGQIETSSSVATAVVCSKQLSCRMTRPRPSLNSSMFARVSEYGGAAPDVALVASKNPSRDTCVTISFPTRARTRYAQRARRVGTQGRCSGVALTEQRTCTRRREERTRYVSRRKSAGIQPFAIWSGVYESALSSKKLGSDWAEHEPVLNVYRHARATAKTDGRTNAPGAPMIPPVPSERLPSTSSFLCPYSLTRTLCVHFRSSPQGRTCSCRRAGRQAAPPGERRSAAA